MLGEIDTLDVCVSDRLCVWLADCVTLAVVVSDAVCVADGDAVWLLVCEVLRVLVSLGVAA